MVILFFRGFVLATNSSVDGWPPKLRARLRDFEEVISFRSGLGWRGVIEDLGVRSEFVDLLD